MKIDISQKTIIVCGIVRNAEKGLRRNIPVINSFCRLFQDFRIVIYENDSTDHTKEVLSEWSATDQERIHVILENTEGKVRRFTAKDVRFHPFCRTEMLGECRNKYMDFISEHQWTADYLMVIDMDVAKIQLKAILTSFDSKYDWDAVAAFGYSTSPSMKRRYHDTFALTEYGDEHNPQTREKIIALAEKYGTLKPLDDWVRVYAAFDGIVIYKFEAIKGARYVTYKNDDDYAEVRCEHYSMGKYMADHGYDKFYINPAMVLKYQNLTWKIIFNTLKRRFGI